MGVAARRAQPFEMRNDAARLVNCQLLKDPGVKPDEWFVLEVEKGLAQIDRGQTLSHEEVGARLNKHLTGRRPPR